jgi:hypothetical protein
MPLGAFRPPKPENRILLRYALDGHEVHVTARQSKMLAVLVLGPRERPWRVRQVRASVVEKLRAAMGKISALGVLRLRAIKRSVRR